MTCESLLSKEIDILSIRLDKALNKKNTAQSEIDSIKEKLLVKKKTLEIVKLDQARKRGF